MNSPQYKQFYSFNPQKEYNNIETRSQITRNIIAHNNSQNLDEIFKKAKESYYVINKSVLDFNKSQVSYKNMAKQLEEENKKKMIEERLKDAQRIKYENIENQIIKQQKQNNYKSLLDNQQIPSYGLLQQNVDTMKPYCAPRSYYLGATNLDHNPILNPVNNYSFAKYYLNKSNLSQQLTKN